ncbi:hypothetical protein [Streptomyces justiciae]|nr:hypothetical protein [Streptomyces justiciae]MCW8381900.1 hypothetical protein [Streptomyces justiciae]
MSVAVVNEQNALPALATLLSAMQQPLIGDDIAGPVNDFAA